MNHRLLQARDADPPSTRIEELWIAEHIGPARLRTRPTDDRAAARRAQKQPRLVPLGAQRAQREAQASLCHRLDQWQAKRELAIQRSGQLDRVPIGDAA